MKAFIFQQTTIFNLTNHRLLDLGKTPPNCGESIDAIVHYIHIRVNIRSPLLEQVPHQHRHKVVLHLHDPTDLLALVLAEDDDQAHQDEDRPVREQGHSAGHQVLVQLQLLNL